MTRTSSKKPRTRTRAKTRIAHARLRTRPRRSTNGIPRAIAAGRVPANERIPVESLRHYMQDLSRAAGRGDTLEARREFARRCSSSVQYLVQLYLGIRRAQPAIAIRIEQASYGLVRAEDLCRDFDWTYAKMRGRRPSHEEVAAPVLVEVFPTRPSPRESEPTSTPA